MLPTTPHAAASYPLSESEADAGEAAELSKLVEAYMKALEASEFDQRLRVIEGRNGARKP